MEEIYKQIITIAKDQRPLEKIVVFGSRAENRSRKTSDIDLAIFARGWDSTDINLLKNRLEEEIKTPLKFDVVNFYALKKESLKNSILEKGKVIYECRED